MSGHSKWATIKHKKGALDAKRGKIFTRLLKEIAVAAKGGGNPDSNARLRTAVLAAKAENMPQENIKRAILRGTGELEGVNYEEITFEGYGPGGVAVIVDVMTDNRNRAVSEIRHAFSKNGGNLGESGSVRFMFSKKGIIAVEKSAAAEEQLMDIVLEHGGEDLNDEGDTWEILTDPASYDAVLAAVKAAGVPTVMNEVTMVASTYTKLEGGTANQMVRLLEVLEDLDDTQNVYSNFDMDTEQMEQALSKTINGPPGCGGLFLRNRNLLLRKGKNIDPNCKVSHVYFNRGGSHGRSEDCCRPGFGRLFGRREHWTNPERPWDCRSAHKPRRPGSQREELGVWPIRQLGHRSGRPFRLQVPMGGRAVGQADDAGPSCRLADRPV